jgi:hypothetical protein
MRADVHVRGAPPRTFIANTDCTSTKLNREIRTSQPGSPKIDATFAVPISG